MNNIKKMYKIKSELWNEVVGLLTKKYNVSDLVILNNELILDVIEAELQILIAEQ